MKNGIKVFPAKEIFISTYITDVIESIMKKNTSLLPTIHESHLAHMMLFKFMQYHGLEDLNIT